MLFYLHYIFMTSGLCATNVLQAVYLHEYTDASQGEIGTLLMTFPLISLIAKPLFCTIADRHKAHRLHLIYAVIYGILGYLPYLVIPFFPNFYNNHPRCAWYILVLGCYLGLGGLGVAGSLGDGFAINFAHRQGAPFGQYRLLGSIGWGVLGLIIGQINETPLLPRFVPAFLVLHAALLAEIILICCWTSKDFITFDSPETLNNLSQQSTADSKDLPLVNCWLPSSSSKTLRLNSSIEQHQLQLQLQMSQSREIKSLESRHQLAAIAQFEADEKRHGINNLQLSLLKLIFSADGQLVKYICLFTSIGLLMAPLNFTFVTIEQVCSSRDYNFSQLVGVILVSQAAMESLCFLVVPKISNYVSRSWCITFAYLTNLARYFFYSNYYYEDEVSPYWAALGEWGLGIGFAVFCTIQTDISMMFANKCRSFIPELNRNSDYFNGQRILIKQPKELIEAEELAIIMTLMATIQGLLDVFMYLGNVVGSLICRIFSELYGTKTVWRIYCFITLSLILIHQLIELLKCRWSDAYEPRIKRTKAHEIVKQTASS